MSNEIRGRDYRFGTFLDAFLRLHRVKTVANIPADHRLSVEAQKTLSEYAAKVHKLDLHLNELNHMGRFVGLLSNNSQGNGPFFPNLNGLTFVIDYIPPNLDLSRLYCSPNLRNFTLLINPYAVKNPEDLKLFDRMISRLPPSLEHLVVRCGRQDSELLRNRLSSFVLKCGSSLKRLNTSVPLSKEAILHLINLPNLADWETSQAPDKNLKSFPPSLERFRIETPEALGWIVAPPHKVSVGQNNSALARPHIAARDNLKSLEIGPGITVDSKLLSCLLPLRNLTYLMVAGTCVKKTCNFGWTDDNIHDLTFALRRLQFLYFQHLCSSNTCKSTVASLVSISVNCLDLGELQIHLNTKNIVSDMNRLIQEGTLDKRPECNVVIKRLSVIPPPPPQLKGTGDRIDKEGKDCVAEGFRLIFPKLAEDMIVVQTSRL